MMWSADITALMARICEDLLTKRDLLLLRMTLEDAPDQAGLDSFLSTWDLEAEGASKSLLMSYFMKTHPELTFPEYCGPRLKGLLDYFRFQNIKLIAQYKQISGQLYKEGISVTVFKGGAMRHLRPSLPRIMNDIDVLVAPEDYQKAAEVISRMGFDISWDRHSFDVHRCGSEEGILDVHKIVPMMSGREDKLMPELFSRAVPAEIFGVPGQILCEEDMVYTLLVNLSRNIMNNTSVAGILFTFIDVKYLIASKADFRWSIVYENARKAGAEKLLGFSAAFMEYVVPGLLPGALFPDGDSLGEMATIVKYRRYLLCPLQLRSHKLGVGTVLRHPRQIPDFLRVRPKYTFLKAFKDHPKWAGFILDRYETV